MNHGTHSAYVHRRCRCEQCRIAEKAYQAGYRAANAERLREYDRQPARDTRLRDDPVKRQARQKAYDNLERQPCERCGDADAQRHHDDYERPLDVRWLCSSCHGIEHRKPNTAAWCGLL